MTQVVKVTVDGGAITTEPMEFLTHATAKARRMSPTGPQLAAEIDELMERRPDISRHRFGKCINGCGNGIGDIRKRSYPRAATVLKVRALIADPPPECLKQVHPRANPNGPQRARKGEQTLEDYQRRCHIKVRRLQAVNRKKAQARIDAGQDWRTAKSASIRMTQKALEQGQAEVQRHKDPVEQALTTLRQNRRVVFRASVYNGPHNRFIIDGRGSETIDERQLMQMAAKVCA